MVQTGYDSGNMTDRKPRRMKTYKTVDNVQQMNGDAVTFGGIDNVSETPDVWSLLENRIPSLNVSLTSVLSIPCSAKGINLFFFSERPVGGGSKAHKSQLRTRNRRNLQHDVC